MLFHVGFTVKLYLALDRYCSLFSGDHEFAESIVAVMHGHMVSQNGDTSIKRHVAVNGV